MKTTSVKIIAIPLLSYSLCSSSYAEGTQPTETLSDLSVNFEINRFKDEQGSQEWDGIMGSSPPPDVYGSLQWFDQQCEIPLHKDSLLVDVTCKVKQMKIGDRISVQLYDRDRIGQDDVIAIGTVEFKENPTVVTLGPAKITLLYSTKPPQGQSSSQP